MTEILQLSLALLRGEDGGEPTHEHLDVCELLMSCLSLTTHKQFAGDIRPVCAVLQHVCEDDLVRKYLVSRGAVHRLCRWLRDEALRLLALEREGILGHSLGLSSLVFRELVGILQCLDSSSKSGALVSLSYTSCTLHAVEALAVVASLQLQASQRLIEGT